MTLPETPAVPPLPAWLAIHIGRTPYPDVHPVNRAGMNRLLRAAKVPVKLAHTTVTDDELAVAAQHAPEDAAQAQKLMVLVVAAYSGSSLRNNKARLAAIAGAEAAEHLRAIAATANEDVAQAYAMFRTGSRNTFSHIGPAIFTRYLAHVTPEAFILDSQVATTLNRAGVGIDPTGPWSASTYADYITTLYTWAGEFHDPADIELALTACPPATEPMEFTGDTGRMLAHLLGVPAPAPTTWGLAAMDKKFGPLTPGTVTLVTGREPEVVQAMLLTIALGNARRGATVDLVTSRDPGEVWASLLAGATGIPVADLTARENAGRAGAIVDKAPRLAGTVRVRTIPEASNADVLIDDHPVAHPPAARRGVAHVGVAAGANPPDGDLDAFIRVERADADHPDHARAGEVDIYDLVNNTGCSAGNALHLGRLVDLGKRRG